MPLQRPCSLGSRPTHLVRVGGGRGEGGRVLPGFFACLLATCRCFGALPSACSSRYGIAPVEGGKAQVAGKRRKHSRAAGTFSSCVTAYAPRSPPLQAKMQSVTSAGISVSGGQTADAAMLVSKRVQNNGRAAIPACSTHHPPAFPLLTLHLCPPTLSVLQSSSCWTATAARSSATPGTSPPSPSRQMCSGCWLSPQATASCEGGRLGRQRIVSTMAALPVL